LCFVHYLKGHQADTHWTDMETGEDVYRQLQHSLIDVITPPKAVSIIEKVLAKKMEGWESISYGPRNNPKNGVLAVSQQSEPLQRIVGAIPCYGSNGRVLYMDETEIRSKETL